MVKSYRVKELSYIGGRLCPVGTIVHDIENPGKNLELVDGSAVSATAAPVNLVGPFKIKHNGGGNFVVLDANNVQVGDVYKKDADDAAKAKTDAQAEADRLNGASTPAAPVDPTPAADPTGTNLPDA